MYRIHIHEGNERFFYGYVIVAAGFCVWLVAFGTFTAFGIFFKPVLVEFGWTRADTSLAYALAILVMGVVSIAIGWLSDQLGPRIVVTVFGSFLGISYLLMSQMSAIWQFHIYYALLTAIGMSTATAPIMATVARWFARRRGLMTGIVQSGLGIGGLIFSPLAAMLITNHGWRKAYVIMGIITLSGIVISGLFLKRSSRYPSRFQLQTNQMRPLVEVEHKAKLQHVGPSLREVIFTKQFWVLAGLYSSFGFCRSTFLVHTPVHVQDIGFSLNDGANVMAALSLSSIAGRIGMGRLADILGNKFAFISSYALTGMALIWALITNHLWGMYLFAIVFGYGWGAQAVLRFLVTSEAFGLGSLGFLIGVLGIGEALAGGMGLCYAGYVFDIAGAYSWAFWIGIAVSGVGALLAALYNPATNRAAGKSR